MRLFALKPCSFGGEKFYIGDEVPSEYVLNPSAQVQMGVLAEVPDNGTGDSDCEVTPIIVPDSAMTIIVQTENGTTELEPTDEGIQDIFTVLIGKPAGAKAIINKMDDTDALFLLYMADGRTTVKTAVEARIKELNGPQESEGEQ